MPVTNEQIMEKLNKIELLLQKLFFEEESELQEIHKISSEENEELKELEIISKSKNLEFENIEDWKRYLWEGCEFKVEKSDGQEINFFCKKLNAACRFDDCPLNYKK